MLVLYIAILAMLRDRWNLSALLVSFALSIKMNILLFAPGFALLVLRRKGIIGAIQVAIIVITLQVFLGLPFLVSFPWEYLKGAFDFGRVFTYIWTVNLKFLDEQTFTSSSLAKTLLFLHLTLLAVFLGRREMKAGLSSLFTMNGSTKVCFDCGFLLLCSYSLTVPFRILTDSYLFLIGF